MIDTIVYKAISLFWDPYIKRIRIRIRNVRIMKANKHILISFEAENISNAMTSFEPEVALTGWSSNLTQTRIYYTKLNLVLSEPDRQLPPYTAKNFSFKIDQNNNFIFWWFVTIRFHLTRGRSVNYRFENIDFSKNRELGLCKFLFKLSMLRLFSNKLFEKYNI